METISRNVEDLVVGNRVDLESCPFLQNHPTADSEYAVVAHVDRETPDCVVIGYEGIDRVGYPLGTVLQVRAPKVVPDPVVMVQPVGGNPDEPVQPVDWLISQNLTDRWGELNYHNAANKPLEELEDDEALFERLRAQMWDELTFIVRKNGQFGVLFEAEYCSKESEEGESSGDSEFDRNLKPHEEVVKALLKGMKPLADQFPGVLFAVPDKEVIINDRPAAWAFVADGLLTETQREALGRALLSL
ncbi:hypothetical protein F6X40_17435 [Paraburkholderia sp. UCT31]|uniref:hypothetical protein n=1 Tax=Paraburkholderia sp. UCT31 TaxID=2615209 RepID=UPI001654C755|nr:hypothetical protein [Paraburkholderia sp. UCT31]MBC8738545.1 hypothetical protein [Paraburkholderia sp. UCT31]